LIKSTFENFVYLLYHIIFKNPSFLVRIFIKKKKALQQKPKGFEVSGSPYWTASELLRGI
jgi:hypothetical protein